MDARLTQIPKAEVLRYLGYRGQDMDQRLQTQIQACISAVMDCARARLTYRIVEAKDALPLPGRDIRTLLGGCTGVIFMAATLGPEAEALLRRTEITNMADALIMDSAESAAIENVCDNFEADMRLEMRAKGLYLTDRYSPGYGDLPLECQSAIIDMLVASKRIGLTVTPSNIMVPRKSVTCIIGVSDRPRHLSRRGCANCALSGSCPYRAKGETCNG